MPKLINRLKAWAHSPQGQRVIRDASTRAQRLARDPATRARIARVRGRVGRRRTY
jgi:hypothetical protein